MEGERSFFMKIPAGVALILVLDGIFQASSRGKLLAVGAALAMPKAPLTRGALLFQSSFYAS